MKTILIISAILISSISFSQISQTQFEEVPCRYNNAIGLMHFAGKSDPILNVFCNQIGFLTIEHLGIGLYRITTPSLFTPDDTWLYVQSEAFAPNGNGREIQCQVQQDGNIYIQAYQDGALSNIVLDNVSFEIRVF